MLNLILLNITAERPSIYPFRSWTQLIKEIYPCCHIYLQTLYKFCLFHSSKNFVAQVYAMKTYFIQLHCYLVVIKSSNICNYSTSGEKLTSIAQVNAFQQSQNYKKKKPTKKQMWKTMTERADIPHISQVYSGALNMKGLFTPVLLSEIGNLIWLLWVM